MKWRAAIVAAVAMRISGALAASTTLAKWNNYYYTVPRSTNIVGLVMGENADYKLIRYEDVAWINEGWAERIALAESRLPQVNAFPEWALVMGREEAVSTSEYWTNATMRTTEITNYLMGNLSAQATVETIVERASGGTAGSGDSRIAPPGKKGLLCVEAVTNAYKVLKKMKDVVKRIEPGATNWVEVVEEKGESWYDGEKEYDWDYVNTYTNENAKWYMEGHGEKEVQTYLEWDWGEQEWWIDHRSENWETWISRPTGKVRFETTFGVRKTNDWFRGWARPKVVKEVHAYGVVYVRGEEYENRWKRSFWWTEGGGAHGWDVVDTNLVYRTKESTVLVDLGVPTWKGVALNGLKEDGTWGICLAYEVEVDIAAMMGQCAGVAEGMPKPKEIEEANAVPEYEIGEWQEGKIEKSKWLECEIKKIYLVIKLRPITSLEGW